MALHCASADGAFISHLFGMGISLRPVAKSTAPQANCMPVPSADSSALPRDACALVPECGDGLRSSASDQAERRTPLATSHALLLATARLTSLCPRSIAACVLCGMTPVSAASIDTAAGAWVHRGGQSSHIGTWLPCHVDSVACSLGTNTSTAAEWRACGAHTLCSR